MLNPRKSLRDDIRLLSGGTGDVGWRATSDDPGLFGPRSIVWKVHGDFTSMMIGGASALFMQMLHPAVMGGVWDHSDFREDMLGRLRRTAQFISGVTYGNTTHADRLFVRVRSVHEHIRGVLPDGRLYSAADPALLTYVHVASARGFLDAYVKIRAERLSQAMRDRYFEDSAEIARRLGAENVPESERAVIEYLNRIRPLLRADERSLDVAHALLRQPMPRSTLVPMRRIFMDAAVALLPPWAAELHGFRPSPQKSQMALAQAQTLGVFVRWILK